MLAGSDKKAHLTKVKVGIKNKDLAQIESGIKENDSVITVGSYALPDGTQIVVEATPAAEEKGAAAGDEKNRGEVDPKSTKETKPAKGKE